MNKRWKSALIWAVALSLSALSTAFAQVRDASSRPQELTRYEVQKTTRRSVVSVIVKLEDAPLASYRGGIPGLAATSPSATGAAKLNVNTPACRAYLSYLNGKLREFEEACHRIIPDATMTHAYRTVLGGVALVVPADQVELVATIPGVTAVYRDRLLMLDTETSPKFIGADKIWKELGGQESAGEGVIVGVLDTGVWPEHPSWSDPDPNGNTYPAPPTMPGSNGFGLRGPKSTCDFGNTAFNPNDDPFTCNNKLISAYDFLDTYRAVIGLLPEEFGSARDADGHGTHTSTTAAGNGVVSATLLGVDRGLVSGIAPRAHAIMYKVCGDEGCFGSDSAAAVEQAILDDVDVINFSIGGGTDPYSS